MTYVTTRGSSRQFKRYLRVINGKCWANPAAPVDAPIALLSAIVLHSRRDADQYRSRAHEIVPYQLTDALPFRQRIGGFRDARKVQASALSPTENTLRRGAY